METCPKCGEPALTGGRWPGGVAVDRCTRCGGAWLDAGELEALLRAECAAADLALLSPGPSALACPRCGVKLLRGGLVSPLLQADKCPACGGIWLDAGEPGLLKKIAAEAAAKSAPPAAAPADPVPGAAVNAAPAGKPAPRPGRLPEGPGLNDLGLQAGFTRSAVPEDAVSSFLQGKAFPFAAALFGFGGAIHQVFKYLNAVDKVPFQTAPGLAGLAQSFGWFLAVTVGCIVLFLYGLYMLFRDVANIHGDK